MNGERKRASERLNCSIGVLDGSSPSSQCWCTSCTERWIFFYFIFQFKFGALKKQEVHHTYALVKYRKCFISVCNNARGYRVTMPLLWYLTKIESTEKKKTCERSNEAVSKIEREKKVELWRNGSLRFIDTWCWWTRFISVLRLSSLCFQWNELFIGFCSVRLSGAIEIASFIVASPWVQCTHTNTLCLGCIFSVFKSVYEKWLWTARPLD